MRALALLTVVFLLCAFSAPAIADDVRDPGKVNKILPFGSFSTPDLAPGDTGTLAFNVSNPYATDISSVTLSVGIYQYTEQEQARAVDSSWQYPKLVYQSQSGNNITFNLGTLAVNSSVRIYITVLTSTDMPHGGIFNQGSYFIRFWLTFIHEGSLAKLASPGYWTKEQFQYATLEGASCPPAYCVGQVNLSRLQGISGLIPDTSFGVKDQIPIWPFYAMAFGAGFFIVLAFLYYAEENPARFPRTARSFAYFKGRFARVFRPRGGKKGTVE